LDALSPERLPPESPAVASSKVTVMPHVARRPTVAQLVTESQQTSVASRPQEVSCRKSNVTLGVLIELPIDWSLRVSIRRSRTNATRRAPFCFSAFSTPRSLDELRANNDLELYDLQAEPGRGGQSRPRLAAIAT